MPRLHFLIETIAHCNFQLEAAFIVFDGGLIFYHLKIKHTESIMETIDFAALSVAANLKD